MKTAIYVRSANKDGMSLKVQENEIRQYLRKEDGEYQVYKVYKDNGSSGIDLNRPGLKQLLSDAEAGKFQSVSVHDIHRLSRSLIAYLSLLKKLENLGITLKTKAVDLSSSTGRLQSKLQMVFTDFEREVRSERIKIGIQRKQTKKRASNA